MEIGTGIEMQTNIKRQFFLTLIKFEIVVAFVVLHSEQGITARGATSKPTLFDLNTLCSP